MTAVEIIESGQWDGIAADVLLAVLRRRGCEYTPRVEPPRPADTVPDVGPYDGEGETDDWRYW